MTESLSVRVALVVLLAVVGVGLAVIGTTVGIGGGSSQGNADRIAITDDSVTISDGETETVAIEDLSTVSTVAVTAHEDHVAIETDEPFDDEDRQRAIEIARANETIRTELAVERYEFNAKPIEKLSVDQSRSVNFSVENDDLLNDSEYEAGETATFSVNVTEDHRNESVTVDRDAEYVEDVLQVTVVDPETDDRRFSVRVDLQTETVETVTDWNEHRTE